MNHPYDFEDIEDYENGRMSEADRKAFELVLSKNKTLQKELEAVRAQANLLVFLRKEALMEEMEKWGDGEGDAEKEIVPIRGRVVPFNFRTVLAIAATLAVLIAAYLLFRENKKEPGYVENPVEHPVDSVKNLPNNQSLPPVIEAPKEEVVDKKDQKSLQQKRPSQEVDNLKFSQYADAGIERIAGSLASSEKRAINPNDTTRYDIMLQLFREKQYAKIATMDGRRDDRIIYLQAISFYRLKKYREAVRAFHTISSNKNLGLDAQWGEVMSQVALLPASCQELKNLLQSIQDSEFYQYHHYKKELDSLGETIGLSTACPD